MAILKVFNKETQTYEPAEMMNVNAVSMAGFKYSEEEQIIGSWIDGKPLYKMTIPFTTGNIKADTVMTGLIKDMTDFNVDEVITVEGAILNAASNEYMPLPVHDVRNNLNQLWNVRIWYINSTHELKWWVFTSQTNGNYANSKAQATITYTKTTDRPNSFTTGMLFEKMQSDIIKEGSVQKYSTDEIVIGEWIDGKPLYRKVIHILKKDLSTKTIYNHNISNIDLIKSISAVTNGKGTTNGYSRNLPWVYASGTESSSSWFAGISANETVFLIAFGENHFNTSVNDEGIYVFFEYTKTTDSPNSFSLDMLPATTLDTFATDEEVEEVIS